MKPSVAKASAAVDQAAKALARTYREQDKVVVALVPCRLCKAPVGQSCCKGTWPSGVRTRSHTERRDDAEKA